jgi:4-amino-4-deoxychorismate lyase
MPMPEPLCLVNGTAASTVAVGDRGLHYGDGVFETIAVRAGQPCLWSLHLERLCHGLDRLGISRDGLDTLEDEMDRLLRGAADGVLKLIVTRGPGPPGYGAGPGAAPTRILLRYPPRPYPRARTEHGVVVRRCRTRLAVGGVLAGIKHLNRLEQVLARNEWDDPGIAEGLMADHAGRLISGTMSNLFLVRDGVLLTPSLQRCGIAGTVRARVLAQAAVLGVPVAEADLPIDALETADGAFLTNALIGIWPIRAVDGRALSIEALPGELITAVRVDTFMPEPN